MQKLNLTEEEQKILGLLHSGTEPNDRLALEIVKNNGKVRPYLGALVCIVLTTQDIELGENILSFISNSLNDQQKDKIFYHLQKTNYTRILLGQNRDLFSFRQFFLSFTV